MKRIFVYLLIGLLLLSGCQQDKTKSAKDFVEGLQRTVLQFDKNGKQPTKEEVTSMLKVAMEAPSGRNKQPYWITAIMDYDTQMKLALSPETKPEKSTVMFLFSAPVEGNPSLQDISIAYTYLQLQAQALGYGGHIYMEPAFALQAQKKDNDFSEFGIPEGYKPYTFILVGPSDTQDVQSSVTTYERKQNYNIFK